MINNVKYILAGVSVCVVSVIASAQVVIVSAQSNVSNLTKEQVERLYLGQTAALPGGGSASLVDNLAIRDVFYPAATGKSGDQAKLHWGKLEFTGKAKPPAELANGKAVVDKVAKDTNAIGYVDKSDVNNGVKVVLPLH